MITGAVISSTVMVWMQVLALPQLSVAVQVRVMTTAQGSVLFTASREADHRGPVAVIRRRGRARVRRHRRFFAVDGHRPPGR